MSDVLRVQLRASVSRELQLACEVNQLKERIAHLESLNNRLSPENMTLTEEVQRLTAENRRLESELQTSRNARDVLYAENQRLRADGELLNWLQERGVCHIEMDSYADGIIDVAGNSVRKAIAKRRDEIAARGGK
jgi:chromosome segregation ATPase